LLELAADLGIIQVLLVLQTEECKSYGVMEASTQISKKGLGDQAMCDRVTVPAGSPCKGDA
jgi:hypothetical protein